MDARSELGRQGEEIALEHLAGVGMEVLERNWRCSFGEIDLIARDGDCLVVCEVKTRTSDAFGAPWEAVTGAKLKRLRKLAGVWLMGQGVFFPEIRIDVVGILAPPDRPARLEHLRAVG